MACKSGPGKGEGEMAGPDPNQELVVVFESANPIELDIAKSALEEAGVQFVVPDEGRIGFGVTPIINPGYRIQVAQECEGQALELMKDLFGAGGPERGHGHRR
jgi:hypothetical protein